MDLAGLEGVRAFGYVMPLREARFRPITQLMKRQVEPTFRVLATVGLELSHSFFQLHSKGLCYRDISFGNVLFDPHTGQILICDNDNVTVDGDQSGGVLGTPRFMAPEVVRGEALPSRQTDLFSLSVLLFYVFILHHPLEGAREAAIHSLDLPAMRRLYGTDPIFIFDPDDSSNRPLPNHHRNALELWPIYPQFLRDLFLQAFTVGLEDAQHGRVVESVWRAAMVRLRDSIVYCSGCGLESFHDPIAPANSDRLSCWSCGRELQLPPHLIVDRQAIMLNHDCQLFPHHIDPARPHDFSSPQACVVQHPEGSKWGLRNLSSRAWRVQSPHRREEVVEPGMHVTLSVGARIDFGSSQGEIQSRESEVS
jgi:serine/threonine protein kinase